MKRHTQLHLLHAPQCGADLPASFGRIFVARRKKLGLSREDAAHETRIHVRWIRLLEEGNVAAFGSITYARSFLRAYSAFLGVDASAFLKALPERGVLGGPRDYRYLTQSQGAWIREREGSQPTSPPAMPGLRHIRSPIPAGLTVFVLMLATTAMWAVHLTDMQPAREAVASQNAAFKVATTRDQASAGVPVARRDHRLLSER